MLHCCALTLAVKRETEGNEFPLEMTNSCVIRSWWEPLSGASVVNSGQKGKKVNVSDWVSVMVAIGRAGNRGSTACVPPLESFSGKAPACALGSSGKCTPAQLLPNLLPQGRPLVFSFCSRHVAFTRWSECLHHRVCSSTLITEEE